MTTVSDLLADVATAVEGLGSLTRQGSDYRDDLEAIPAGTTRYKLRGAPAGVDADSNVSRAVAGVELELKHRLADPYNERAWTESGLLTLLASLNDPAWWRSAIASAFDVLEAPAVTTERSVNVVRSVVTVRLSVRP